MKQLVLLLLVAASLNAQPVSEDPLVSLRILYVDRPPTPAEVAAAESSGKPLEPTIYFLAPSIPGKSPEFSPLLLPFSRLSDPVTLPAGSPLSLFAKPELSSKFAQVDAGKRSEVLAVLKASRAQDFRDAKLRILDTSGPGFPPGHLRVINLSDMPISVKTLDPLKQIPPGETLTFQPTPGRRNTVPLVVSVNNQGVWREFHAGAAKLSETTRVTVLVTGQASWERGSPYSVEYLSETSSPVPQ